MTQVRVTYVRPDGGLSVTPMDESAVDTFMVTHLPKDATDVRVLQPDELPATRVFRDAWAVKDGNTVAVEMTKARELHRDQLREKRAPLLAKLDVDYMRALEAGDAKAQADIVAKKNGLRDVTADPAIEAARTPEELAAVLPELLANVPGKE